MLSYSRHTTNSFEATTTTEAGLLVLVTGCGFETRERRSGLSRIGFTAAAVATEELVVFGNAENDRTQAE